MKKLTLMFVFSLVNISAFAQTVPNLTSSPQFCSGLVDPCKAAGFVKDGAVGKNFMINCVIPLLSGQAVVNVTATPMQIQSCKDDVNHLPCAHIINQCQQAGYTGGPGKLVMFDCLLPLVKGKAVAGMTPAPDELKTCQDTMNQQLQAQPCLRVMMACKEAGYSPDQVNGAAFVRNCYGPLLDGSQVKGISIDAATTKACAAQSPSGTHALQTPGM